MEGVSLSWVAADVQKDRKKNGLRRTEINKTFYKRETYRQKSFLRRQIDRKYKRKNNENRDTETDTAWQRERNREWNKQKTE